MKKCSLLVLIVLLTFNVFAQFPGARGGGANMNMGTVYGKILLANNKPFDGASIQILQSKFDTITKTKKDRVISGQLTNGNGEFRIESLPIGIPLKVKITAVGYASVEKTLQFVVDMSAMKSGDMSSMLNSLDKDLGNIKLTIQVIKGEDVTVVAERPGLQLGVDRKIFNVDKNIVSAGGTGVDILRNVPSVQVDLDGNITLRNSSPQLFVDGRPTPLTLDQIPSDAIASVELITNPSAKFDASGGTSGIINIVLKKNKKIGYNGSIRANIDSRAKIGAGGDINVRQNKVNVFFSANYNQRKSISWGQSIRNNYFGTPQTNLIQRNDNVSNGAFVFVRPGFDYFINNRNTLSVSSSFVRGQFDPNDVIDIYQSSIGAVTSAFKSFRKSNSALEFKNNGVTTSYKHLFIKPGNEITADVTFNKSTNINNADFENAPYINAFSNTTLQQIRTNGGRKTITAQTDYTMPIGKSGKYEAGLRYNQSDVTSNNNNFIKLPGAVDFTYLPQIGYDFASSEKVLAAYNTYAQKINKTNVQLGLRWESSTYDGNLINRNQKFSNSFPNSFFPSLFITQSLGKGQDLQLNYTRKINRPNFFQLLPFVDYADSLNVTRGNPALLPEFTNSVEISYQLPYKKNDVFLASVYFKNTNNLIARFQTKENLIGQDLIVNSYINANASQVYGLEVTNKSNITSYFDLSTNLNFYGSKLEVPGLPVIKNNLSWFGKVNSNFKLPKNLTLQLSGDYQSRSVLPPGGNGGGGSFGGGGGGRGGGMFGGSQSSNTQGYIKPNWGVDFAIKKDFLKDRKASISLNVNDIFRTKVNWIITETSLFYQDSWRRRDPQVFRLNLSYRFGKFDTSIFKRKNMKGEGEGMRGAMEGGM
jgi:outer membrane receptor protein involved in Fe transport